MHGPDLAFQITCTTECDLQGVFLCSWLCLINAAPSVMLWEYHIGIQQFNSGVLLHCLWVTFGLQSMMYMDGVWGCIVVRNCQCREENSPSSADSDFTDVQSLLLPPAFFFPSLILFSAFHFLHKGKMRKNKTNIWKLKHDREGRGWGGRGGGTEEGEAISENKRAFKSKGWKLVRLLFLKNDPCVVLLLRARYILFYLPEETQRGVLAQKYSAMVSFKLRNLLFLMLFLTGVFSISSSVKSFSNQLCGFISQGSCSNSSLPQRFDERLPRYVLLYVIFIRRHKLAERHHVTSEHALLPP